MGLFDRLRGIKDPLDGTFRLVACSTSSGGAVVENCTMDGVVVAPGVPPTPVHHVSLLTPTAKWPQPGQTLPVTLDRRDPSRLRIRWDDVPPNAQIARRLAQEQAREAPAGTGDPGTGGPSEPSTRAVLGAEGRPEPGTAGGGLSPAESARATQGGAATLGLQPLSARVLAAHEVVVPAGLAQAPGGTWDLTLDVEPQTGPGWSTVLRVGFRSPERKAEVARIGRVLPVLADPVRHDRIAIDAERLGG